MVLVKPENLSALSTAADKAAALTYLKSNYNWPKSIQFEDKESYNLSFVMNNNSGTIAMNVIKPTGEYTSEHCGTAYLDALVMVDMTEAQRTSLVSKAAEAALQEHITTKKKFIAAQMQAIQVGGIVEVNGVKHTVTGASNTTLETTAVKDKIKMWQGKQQTTTKYYDKVFLDNLKKQTSFSYKFKPGAIVPVDDPSDIDYMETGNKTVLPSNMPASVKNAMKEKLKQAVDNDGFSDTSNDEQKFIQRVGVMSNLNVSIQGKKRIGITVYRLFCDKCKTPQDIEAGVITQRRIEDKVLVEFCNTHRHVSSVPQAGGERKFKDV